MSLSNHNIVVYFKQGGETIDKIYTLGMDIGTTTTQLVICEVEVENLTSNYLSVEPKILSRKLVYESPIVITPMHDRYHLNEEALTEIFFSFIKESGVDISKIKTGAAIITGESSLKENAGTLIHHIADCTGEFIAATAGADLEAILAGCGSGVKDLSYKNNSVLTNIDIGGGTTNIAAFDKGEVKDTLALHIGGRLLKIDSQFKITYISPVLKEVLKTEDILFEEGDNISGYEMVLIAEIMVNYLVRAIDDQLASQHNALYISKQKESVKGLKYFISGGVGEYAYDSFEYEDLMKACLSYEDIGPLLGQEIKKAFKKKGWILDKPKQRIRATVCGSGSYSMQLSGNTICVDEAILPLKNLPLIRVSYKGDAEAFISSAKRQIGYYKAQPALYITYEGDKSYQDIIKLAEGVIAAGALTEDIIVVTDKNIAKALGQTIRRLLKTKKAIVCIDNIQNTHGNYIDLGKMVGGSLPIVIKSLIF